MKVWRVVGWGLVERRPRDARHPDPDRPADLEAARSRAEPRVRRWKRYQAILLRAEGQTVAAVAPPPCGAAWPASMPGRRPGGEPGWRACRRGRTAGASPKLGRGRRRRVLSGLLDEDPQAAATRRPAGRCRCCGRNWPGRLRGGRAHHPPRPAPARLPLEAPPLRAGPARSGLCRKKGARHRRRGGA